MALKGKVYWKYSNNQQGIPYIPAPNLEGMLCKIKSIKISILFFFHFRIFFLVLQIQLLTIKVNLKSKEYKTSYWNRITWFFYCYLPIFLMHINSFSKCLQKKKKRLHDIKHFNNEKKEKEGRRKRKREKEN